MRRYHLFEIEDQPWCPAPIRDAMTDYLQFVLGRMRPFAVLAPRLRAAMERMNTRQVVDLCSGGGGPWASLIAELGDDVMVTLTDLYPNQSAQVKFGAETAERVSYESASVDAASPPVRLRGFRTLINGFHHFPPERAREILVDAVRSGQGIAVFEVVERRPSVMAGMLLAPLFVALVTPAIRPFRWSRLFWTYVLPLVPVFTLFDGVVSCLRVYEPDELREMTAGLTEYHWDIGQEAVPGSPARVTYLIGYSPVPPPSEA